MANQEPKQPPRIVFTTDLYFGQTWYIDNDPDQDPYKLIDINLGPGVQTKDGKQIPSVKLHLQYMRTKIWVDDFQCSLEPDAFKKIENRSNDDDE